MTAYTPYKPGQSIVDLCLQAYGTLDLLVKFCTDNGVADMSAVPVLTQYAYDTDLVKFEGGAEVYATKATIVADVCPVVTGLVVTGKGPVKIIVGWDSNGVMGYEYGWTEDGSTPTTWIFTTETTGAATGLSPGTTYYLFVRSKCNVGFWSEPVSITADTIPAPPVTDGLILALFSDYGVTVDGPGFVSAWTDASGNGNNVTPETINKPKLVTETYGPAIKFNSTLGTQMITPGNLLGLSGEPACTCFIVFEYPSSIVTYRALSYALNPSGLAAGEFNLYDAPTPLPNTAIVYLGDAGFQGGYMPLTANTLAALTYVINTAETALDEIKIDKNDSPTGFVLTAHAENTGVFANAPLRVGAGAEKIACVLMYNRALSAPEKTSVADYLMTRYSI